jgi:hypothetical protein
MSLFVGYTFRTNKATDSTCVVLSLKTNYRNSMCSMKGRLTPVALLLYPYPVADEKPIASESMLRLVIFGGANKGACDSISLGKSAIFLSIYLLHLLSYAFGSMGTLEISPMLGALTKTMNLARFMVWMKCVD